MAELTCRSCGNVWTTRARSSSSRCRACGLAAYVPVAMRSGKVQRRAATTTGAPRSHCNAERPTTAPASALDQAVEHLPTAAHRAAFRLLLDAVTARHHLRGKVRSGWPSFVVCGPSKSAKTLLAIGACRAFGLDTARVVRSLPAETERSLWGRRSQETGGGWRFTASAALGWPLLVLDEADKAPAAVQRATLKLLQGEVLVPAEDDDLVEVCPTLVVTANGGPELIPEEYRRRSVVLDTSPLVDQLGEVHIAARRFLGTLPRLDLASLVPPAAELPEGLADELVAQLRAGLSEDGWRMADERGLALLVLGRAGRTGADMHAALADVIGDYLDAASTVGETAAPPSQALTVPDAGARRDAAARHVEHERDRARAEREAQRELAARVAAVVDELERSRPAPDLVGTASRSAAVMVGATLDAMAGQVAAVSSLAELEELLPEAGELVARGRTLCSWERRVPVDVDEAGDVDEVVDPGIAVESGIAVELVERYPEDTSVAGPREVQAIAGAAGWAVGNMAPGPMGSLAGVVLAIAGAVLGGRLDRAAQRAVPAIQAAQLSRYHPMPALPPAGLPGQEHLVVVARPTVPELPELGPPPLRPGAPGLPYHG